MFVASHLFSGNEIFFSKTTFLSQELKNRINPVSTANKKVLERQKFVDRELKDLFKAADSVVLILFL